MTSRAAIYTRISRDAEGEALGVERQEEDCRALCAREGLTLVGVYTDNDRGASSKSKKARPEYDRLLADARAGRIDVIVAYSASRLTRRPAEWETLISLAESGVTVRTVASGRADFSTADGRAVARTIAAWDAAEAERTGERASRALRQRAERGLSTGGPRAFGWTKDGALDVTEAAVVAEATTRLLAGDTLWAIVKDLKARGVTTSTGRPFVTQTLRRVLLRPENAGRKAYRGNIVGTSVRPALVSEEDFDRLTALLTAPERRTNRGTEPRWLGTSLFRCGVCGGYLVGAGETTVARKSGPPRKFHRRYVCANTGCHKVQRPMAPVDEHVRAFTLRLLARDGVALLGGDPDAARRAQADIETVTARLDIAADGFADGTVTGEQLARINARLRPQLADAQARLLAAQPSPEMAEWATGTEEALGERFDAAPVERKKALLRALGIRVEIHPVGPGNGRHYIPDATRITAESPAHLRG